MSFNPNYPQSAICRKAFNLYSDLCGAEIDIEPHGHAYLEAYKAIGDSSHRVWIDAKAKFGEDFAAVEELELA